MKNSSVSLLLVILLFFCLRVPGQTTPLTDNHRLIGGKWFFSLSDSISSVRHKGPVTIEFFANGKFKFINNLSKIYGKGKWKYNGGKLKLNLQLEKFRKSSPVTYIPVWVDENTFYTIEKGEKEGKKIYMYFSRME